jgi:Flp pilus assembly protein CpaB
VDVIFTTRGGDSSSRIILQNMMVMAVDTQDKRADGQTSMLGQTVTLAATPEEATRLTVAAAGGELRLLLKNGSDVKPVGNVLSRASDLDRPLVGDPDKDLDGPRGGAGGIVPLPKIEDEPRKAEPVPVKEKLEPAQRKRHVMTIRSGLTVEKATFLLGKTEAEDDETTENTPKKDDDEKPEAKKPETPKPAPATSPPAATPSPSGKAPSLRTGRTR